MSPSSIALELEHAPGASAGATPPAAERSDADLVALVLAGRRSAEAELYQRHARAVSAVATRLLGRTADAEDVVQDTFLTAFECIRQLRDPAVFRPWLLRITVRHVHRRFRRRRLLRALGMDRGEDDAALARLVLAPFDTETRAELARLDTALNALAPKQRVAFMLRHVEGYELTEIADACGASLTTIKRWLQRADEIVRAHTQGGAR